MQDLDALLKTVSIALPPSRSAPLLQLPPGSAFWQQKREASAQLLSPSTGNNQKKTENS